MSATEVLTVLSGAPDEWARDVRLVGCNGVQEAAQSPACAALSIDWTIISSIGSIFVDRKRQQIARHIFNPPVVYGPFDFWKWTVYRNNSAIFHELCITLSLAGATLLFLKIRSDNRGHTQLLTYTNQVGV